jgi:hypothetical protein
MRTGIRANGIWQNDVDRGRETPPVDGHRELLEFPIWTLLPAAFICIPKMFHQERRDLNQLVVAPLPLY